MMVMRENGKEIREIRKVEKTTIKNDNKSICYNVKSMNILKVNMEG